MGICFVNKLNIQYSDIFRIYLGFPKGILTGKRAQ